MWSNLRGPARLLAVCATTLLIASALLGAEAGILLILGPARDIVLKPFILLGYVEACAILFSLLGIGAAIIGVIFHRPYLFIREKIFLFRARHAAQVSDDHTWFEDVQTASASGHSYHPEEDGSPD
jgi:mannose/fructose/N-acetylgalactosamine-specific phosphotransferase system component IIC